MLRNFFSLYFWVTFVALTLASGLFWLGAFRHVAGEVSILMLPKVDTAVVAPGNAERIFTSESFQKRAMLDLAKPTLSFGSDVLESKNWSQSMTAQVLPQSSVLLVTVTRETQGETKYLLDGVTKQLIHELGQFYSFESELDLRVIDGPHFETRVNSWPLFLAASAGSGFGVSLVFFSLLSFLERILARHPSGQAASKPYRIAPETWEPSTHVPYWPQQSGVAEEAATLPPLNSQEKEEEYRSLSPEYEAMVQDMYHPEPVAVESVFQESESMENQENEPTPALHAAAVARGKAPDNLPIMENLSPLEAAHARLYKADIDATARVQAKEAEAELLAEVSEEETSTVEPSQEEYKRRLNELLSGRL